MKNISTLLALFTLITPLSAQWEVVGDPDGFTQYEFVKGEIKFQPETDIPFVYYRNSEINVATVVSMKSFNGTSWEFVGTEFMSTNPIADEHITFDFSPVSPYNPYAYFRELDGNISVPRVVTLSGSDWDIIPGIANFSINVLSNQQNAPVSQPPEMDLNFTEIGTPVFAFCDNSCENIEFGVGTGNNSVVVSGGAGWEYLGDPCFSRRPTTNTNIERHPVTNQFYAYHRGGSQETFGNNYRVLEILNGSQWDSVTSPPFSIPAAGFSNVLGIMEINPVNGEIYMYDWGFGDSNFNGREFKVYTWNGTELDSLHGGTDLNIQNANWLAEFHPITGELHILYRDLGPDGEFLNVKKYDGTNWVNTEFSDIGEEINQSLDFESMAFNAEGDLYIIRKQGINGRGVVVKHEGGGTASVNNVNQTSISLYPNPVKDRVFVENPDLGTSSNLKYEIFEITGKTVLSGNLSGDDLASGLDVALLNSGLYILTISSGSSKWVARFVRE